VDDDQMRISTRSVVVDSEWAGFTITIKEEKHA